MMLAPLFYLFSLLVTHCCVYCEQLEIIEHVSLDPDCKRNVSELIASNGYPVKEYHVTTEDGYILGLQRIPGPVGFVPNATHPAASKRVVLIMHGLLSSAADWVINGPNESLAYIMADSGYDVWLGNIRGNTYSRRHKTLSPDDKAFWEFTLDEFIEYDAPSMIDFILNETGEKDLFYVGHSQGTAMLFGLLAAYPQYHDKIRVFGALGPVANVSTITSPIRYLAPFSHDVEFILELLGENEFLPNNAFMQFLAETMCKSHFSRFVCTDAIFLVCGMDSKQTNETRLPVIICHTPAGTSVRNVVHFAQEHLEKRFQKFDFGTEKNLKKYGQATPPEYDIHNVHAPIGLFWSQNDWLADPRDVEIIAQSVSTVEVVYRVPDDYFTHIDFIFGTHANTLVYAPLLAFFSKY